MALHPLAALSTEQVLSCLDEEGKAAFSRGDSPLTIEQNEASLEVCNGRYGFQVQAHIQHPHWLRKGCELQTLETLLHPQGAYARTLEAYGALRLPQA